MEEKRWGESETPSGGKGLIPKQLVMLSPEAGEDIPRRQRRDRRKPGNCVSNQGAVREKCSLVGVLCSPRGRPSVPRQTCLFTHSLQRVVLADNILSPLDAGFVQPSLMSVLFPQMVEGPVCLSHVKIREMSSWDCPSISPWGSQGRSKCHNSVRGRAKPRSGCF